MRGKFFVIKNDLNNYVHLGSTILDLKRRFKWHYNSIYDTKKKNPMYRDMLGNFKKYNISLLHECNIETRRELYAVEKEWIKYFKKNNYNCYNIR